MTSESGVERDATLPEDDARAHPTEGQFERDAEQIAELIKERDKLRDKTEVLERSAILLTSLLAEAEVVTLEAKLELAKERAKQARQLVRDGKPLTTSRVPDVADQQRREPRDRPAASATDGGPLLGFVNSDPNRPLDQEPRPATPAALDEGTDFNDAVKVIAEHGYAPVRLDRLNAALTTSRVVDVYLFETRKNEANGKDA